MNKFAVYVVIFVSCALNSLVECQRRCIIGNLIIEGGVKVSDNHRSRECDFSDRICSRNILTSTDANGVTSKKINNFFVCVTQQRKKSKLFAKMYISKSIYDYNKKFKLF